MIEGEKKFVIKKNYTMNTRGMSEWEELLVSLFCFSYKAQLPDWGMKTPEIAEVR